MTEKIIVHKDGQPVYPIVIKNSFDGLASSLTEVKRKWKRICIVTDSNVAVHYLDEVKKCLETIAETVISFTFPAGEENKNLDTVKDLYKTLILNHFDRNDILAALGGGVVGDLTGFTAATYLRGIDFFQIPTTLLSQVDSSIGGKTGVDFDAYKNMVGAFYQPKLVYINITVLKTLNDRQFSSGMGEVIKHGCIQDSEYFSWLDVHANEILNRDISALAFMVAGSCQIKRRVVEEDPTEKGLRALLNFGHTLGHAIEKEKNFTMAHGECVAVGCIAAAYLSFQRGKLSEAEYLKVKEVIGRFGLPVSLELPSYDCIIAATKNDKKMDSGVIKFVLLHAIGDAYIDRSVTDQEMISALACIDAEKQE